jgi:hypothetical protein
MKQWHMSVRAPKRSAAAQHSNGDSDDRWPIAPSACAFVDFQSRLGLAAEARHRELQDRRGLRRNGTEAQRATATRMPLTAAPLVDVGVHRHVEQMLRRFSTRVVVLMASHERTGLLGMLSNDIARACGKGQGRGHRPKQKCHGEKPCPPSSLWSRQATHLATTWVQYTASAKQPPIASNSGT